MRSVDVGSPAFTYDEDDPPGFRAGMFRPGPSLGAGITGATVYHLPPGQQICPYHYEYGEEEWLLVLQGRPSVRTPDGTDRVEPNEVVFFPTGPAGAHQVINDTDETVRVLMWSMITIPTGTAYPDSDKVALWTGDKAEDLIVRRSSGVEYFDGER